MSESRTHEATPRKLARALSRGDVAQSPELVSAAVLVAFVAVLGAQAEELLSALVGVFAAALRAASAPSQPVALLSSFDLSRVAWAVLPALAVVPAAALLSSLAQTGFGFRAPASPAGAGAAFDPARALSSLGPARFLDAGLTAAKLALVVVVLVHTSSPSLRGVLDSFHRPPQELLRVLAPLLRELILAASIALALAGVLDLIVRHLRRRRRLRMSRRELEDEQRQTQGSPHVLSERTRRARELLAHATLAEVQAAALVLHDDDARAVALAYDPERDAAPKVWLKARGELAARLIDRATRLGCPIERDPALVAELSRLEPTELVPARLHEQLASHMASRIAPAGTERP